MTAPPPRASLLGIPRELRFGIYDIVTTHHVDHDLEHLEDPPRAPHGFRTPITNLALTCRSIASEIRSHARTLQPSQSTAVIGLRMGLANVYDITLITFPCRVRLLKGLLIELAVISGPHDIHLDSPIHSAAIMAREFVLLVRQIFACEGCLLRSAEGIKEVRVWFFRSAAGIFYEVARSEVDFTENLLDIADELVKAGMS